MSDFVALWVYLSATPLFGLTATLGAYVLALKLRGIAGNLSEAILPVGLMPGISGQFFKNFGFTVVVSVLMSLAVARMITPMIAAYFLKAHGIAEHGTGPWMDRYLKVLHWSLDSSKAITMWRANLKPDMSATMTMVQNENGICSVP